MFFIHLVWVEVVEDCTEGQTIPPGRAEVGDLDPFMTLGDFLAPLQQRLAGGDQARAELQCLRNQQHIDWVKTTHTDHHSVNHLICKLLATYI